LSLYGSFWHSLEDEEDVGGGAEEDEQGHVVGTVVIPKAEFVAAADEFELVGFEDEDVADDDAALLHEAA